MLFHYWWKILWGVYDISHTYALQIKNTSESDPQIYKATEAVAKKAQKKFWGFNRILTHDLHNTTAMLYQLSYEASLEAGQEQVQFRYMKRVRWGVYGVIHNKIKC